MHIAAALAIPCYAIFGPTDPKRTGPWGNGHTIFQSSVKCSPCFKKNCPLTNDEYMKCLLKITPEGVLNKIHI